MPPCYHGYDGCPHTAYFGTQDDANTCCAPLAGTRMFACQNPATNPSFCTCTVPDVWNAAGAANPCVDRDCLEKYHVDATSVVAMTTDGANLFLALDGPQTIVSIPTDPSLPRDGTPPAILAPNQFWVSSLAYGEGRLYWIADSSGMTMPSTGGTPTPLAGVGPDADRIAVRGGYLYWSVMGRVMKRSLAGGPDVELSTTATRWAAFGAGLLISEPYRIVLHPVDGGPPRTIASPRGYTTTMDDTNVYWTDVATQENSCGVVTTLYKVALAGGTPIVLAQSRDRAEGLLLADGKGIFWVGGFGIFTMPLDGGAPRKVVQDLTPTVMTVVGTSLYWIDSSTVYKSQL
jgi:hypothetical protein